MATTSTLHPKHRGSATNNVAPPVRTPAGRGGSQQSRGNAAGSHASASKRSKVGGGTSHTHQLDTITSSGSLRASPHPVTMVFNPDVAPPGPPGQEGSVTVAQSVSDVTAAGGPEVANSAWYAMERASKSEKELQHDLQQFIRHTLFPACKMITGVQQLVFSDSQQSICQFVCSGMNVKPSFQSVWWELNKKSVHQHLNRRRTDVSSQIKKGLFSK